MPLNIPFFSKFVRDSDIIHAGGYVASYIIGLARVLAFVLM